MTTPITVLGPPDDHQVRALRAAAARADVELRAVHLTATDPQRWRWGADIVTSEGDVLTDTSGVFVRSMPTPTPHHDTDLIAPNRRAEWLRQAERRRAVLGFHKSAQLTLSERGTPVINELWGYRHHRSKPGADAELAAGGVPVPRGIATDDVGELRSFVDSVAAAVVKPVAGGGRCRVLEPAMLEGALARRLDQAPVYAQELVPGRNLRIYTLDDDVLATFDIEADDIDFRGAETSITEIDLPGDIADTALRCARLLGLRFTGSDIKWLPDGSHVVLDVNPSPMFAGLDRRIDGRIAAALVERLR
ncbi:MAG: hypothetical protein AAGD18_01610 [Actinomycetota bacterium]